MSKRQTADHPSVHALQDRATSKSMNRRIETVRLNALGSLVVGVPLERIFKLRG